MSALLHTLSPPAAAWQAHERMPSGRVIAGALTPDADETVAADADLTLAVGLPRNTTANRRRIYLLALDREISSLDVCGALGMTQNAAQAALRQMCESGVLARVREAIAHKQHALYTSVVPDDEQPQWSEQ